MSNSSRLTAEQVNGGDAGMLASALRGLLSSTMGVSEEEVGDASLPDLIEVLRCKWETILEGMVSMYPP